MKQESQYRIVFVMLLVGVVFRYGFEILDLLLGYLRNEQAIHASKAQKIIIEQSNSLDGNPEYDTVVKGLVPEEELEQEEDEENEDE